MSLSMNWELHLTKKVRKAIRRFPLTDQKHIAKTMREMSLNPFLGDIEKIKGEENIWRRRVGAYRIFCEIVSQDRIIYVFRVERRTSSTY